MLFKFLAASIAISAVAAVPVKGTKPNELSAGTVGEMGEKPTCTSEKKKYTDCDGDSIWCSDKLRGNAQTCECSSGMTQKFDQKALECAAPVMFGGLCPDCLFGLEGSDLSSCAAHGSANPCGESAECPDNIASAAYNAGVVPNGCGSDVFDVSNLRSKIAPEYMPCCIEHDYGYATCGRSKEASDLTFRKCLLEKKDQMSFSQRKGSLPPIAIWGAVWKAGKAVGAHAQKQQKNCECATGPAPGTYTITGGHKNNYCCDEDGGTKCNRGGIGAWEKFTIEELDDGKYAIKGGREGKYCCDDNHFVCNRDSPGSWERFTFEAVSDGKWAIKGGRNGKYCKDNGDGVMKCDADAIGAWETFTFASA